jgi:hypothetical protein
MGAGFFCSTPLARQETYTVKSKNKIAAIENRQAHFILIHRA